MKNFIDISHDRVCCRSGVKVRGISVGMVISYSQCFVCDYHVMDISFAIILISAAAVEALKKWDSGHSLK